MSNRYQNSKCKGGYLHKFRQVTQTERGFLERCERCGKTMHFSHDVPNHYYLSYHIRDVLQDNDPMFYKEYPNAL